MVQLILRERTFDCACKRIHAKKFRKRAGGYSGSELHAILGCEYLLYLLRLNVLNRIEFPLVYKLFDYISLVIHRRYQL